MVNDRIDLLIKIHQQLITLIIQFIIAMITAHDSIFFYLKVENAQLPINQLYYKNTRNKKIYFNRV